MYVIFLINLMIFLQNQISENIRNCTYYDIDESQTHVPFQET